MQSGYYNTTGGMVTQFNRLDLISNNLANLNTTGFKRDDVVIGDYLRLFETHKEQLPIEDFALQRDNAFFVIKTPDGIRYTRDGNFNIDNDGHLVNKDGHLVLSRDGLDSQEGIIIPTGMYLESDNNGNLYLRNINNDAIAEQINIGALAVVGFENPRYLKKVGKNLYEYPQDRLDERDIMQNSAMIAQGFLEKSNVNAVLEMSSLIETNRLVDMYSKVMKSHMDDLNTEAITKLAVRA